MAYGQSKHLVLGMRNFRELRIWQDGMTLVVDIYRVANQLPKQEDYGLKSQVKRAAVSIVANIAEGCSRSSQKEFKHFLEISLGSTFEVETDLLVAEKLEFITTDQLNNLIPNIQTLQRQINALITKLK